MPKKELKNYSNKELHSDRKSTKIFSFKGNPPVSIEAENSIEAEEKFKKLQGKKK